MADEAKRTGRGMREAMVTLAIFSLTIIAASPASADLSGGAYAAERGVSSGLGEQAAIRLGHGEFLMGAYVGAEGEVAWDLRADGATERPRQTVDVSLRLGTPLSMDTMAFGRVGWRDRQVGEDSVGGAVFGVGIERPLSSLVSLRVEALATDWAGAEADTEIRASTAWRLGDVESLVPTLTSGSQMVEAGDPVAGWHAVVVPVRRRLAQEKLR